MTPAAVASRRVVVTGLGAVSPLGNSFPTTWSALLKGECGVTSLADALHQQGLPEDGLARELTIAQTLPCPAAAPVKGFHDIHKNSEFINNRTPRFVQFALAAGREALQHAGLLEKDIENNNSTTTSDVVHQIIDRDRFGVGIGTGMSSVREIMQAGQTIQDSNSIRKLSPHFVPKVLSNTASGRLATHFDLRGPNHCPATACAASTHAIGDAFRFIQAGMADCMLAGGTESCIDPLSLAGFCRLRALSPTGLSRPFDAHRDGFVLAEGACVLVLEELAHAVQRGATPLAEITGYGLSGDAFHATAPHPEGLGAQRAMRMALDQRTKSLSIDYVNAHATSTPKGDEIEAHAIQAVLGNRTQQNNSHPPVWVSSTKGSTGHLLGAAGALEAAFTVQTLVDQVVPPTRLETLDPACQQAGLEHCYYRTTSTSSSTTGVATPGSHRIQAALTNSFGFGGTNASLLMERFD